jgi:hypothetical protein
MHDYSKLIHFFYCLQGVDMGNESEESVGNWNCCDVSVHSLETSVWVYQWARVREKIVCNGAFQRTYMVQVK